MPQQEQSTIIRRSHSNLCLLSCLSFVLLLVCHFFVSCLGSHLSRLSSSLFVVCMCLLLSSIFVIFVCHLCLSSSFVAFIRYRRRSRVVFAEHLLLILFLRPRYLPSSFLLFLRYLRLLLYFVIFVRYLSHLSHYSPALFVTSLVCRLTCLSYSSFVICVVCCPHFFIFFRHLRL